MKKFFVLLFIFFIIFNLNCSVFAVSMPPTNNNVTSKSTSLNIVTYSPYTFILPLMYFIFILIAFGILKQGRNKTILNIYKIIILIMTFGLFIAFKGNRFVPYFYTSYIFLGLIEIFIGIFPKKNKTRIILTLIPVILFVILLIIGLATSEFPNLDGDTTHEIAHKIEIIVLFGGFIIIPEIISQIALAPIYLYHKKIG